MSGLPSFFQSGGTTALEELTNFDLENDLPIEGEDLLDAIIDDDLPIEDINEDTFADTFGDLKMESLPEYFVTPGRNAIPEDHDDDDVQDILTRSTAERLKDQAESMSSQIPLPPFGTPSSFSKSASRPVGPPPGLPPGLTPTPSKKEEPLLSTPSNPPGLLTPFSAKIGMLGSNTEGLFPTTPSAEPQSPATTTGNVSVVSSILSPPQIERPPQQPFFTQKPNFGRGKYMSTSDVRFVVSKVLQPLETLDPYADDFYFIQFTIKKNLREREKALKEAQAPPPPMNVPLPTWKDTKERIKSQIESSRKVFVERTKEWEEKEQVLGHRIRAEVSRPRELLSLPSMNELDFDFNEDDDVEWKAPFTSRLWSTRLAVQRGYEALFTVQELQYLLTNPLILASSVAVDEIKREIDAAVLVLSQSLGIRTIENDPFASLSLNNPSTGGNSSHNIQLDGRHIAAILQTSMGKKLLTRGLKLLNPTQRWTLIPIVLARILMNTNPAGTAPATAAPSSSSAAPSSSSAPTGTGSEAVEVEKRLLKTIIEYLQFTYKQYNDLRQTRLDLTVTYSNDLLNNLRQCLKNVMITQMEKNQLRESLLSERTRAEVMHVIVTLGDNISSLADQRNQEEWKQTRDAFMSFLD